MRFGSTAVPRIGSAGAPNIVSFNPATGLYEADGTYPDMPVHPAHDNAISKDPATEDVYIWPAPPGTNGNQLVRWNQATNTWAMIISGGTPVSGFASAIDS